MHAHINDAVYEKCDFPLFWYIHNNSMPPHYTALYLPKILPGDS